MFYTTLSFNYLVSTVSGTSGLWVTASGTLAQELCFQGSRELADSTPARSRLRPSPTLTKRALQLGSAGPPGPACSGRAGHAGARAALALPLSAAVMVRVSLSLPPGGGCRPLAASLSEATH